MASRTRAKKKKRDEEEQEEEDERVLFFIPSGEINIEVLVFYLRRFLGHDSDAEPGTHPRDREQDGYFVRSRLGLSAVMVNDLKQDSRSWKDERKSSRGHEGYPESETAARRVRNGASGQPTIPEKTRELAARRAVSAQPTADLTRQGGDTQWSARHQEPQQPTRGNVPAPYPMYGQNVAPQQQSYGSPYGQQGGSMPGAEYNLNVNVANYSLPTPQGQTNTARYGTPQVQQPGPVLPSIESSQSRSRQSRHGAQPPPAYESDDGEPDQPDTTGSFGFQSKYAPAGTRHQKQ